MQLINYLDTIIIKIDKDIIYLQIDNNEIIKWPRNKISNLDIHEGKKMRLILGGEEILEDQKNILLKKIINEIIEDGQQN